MMADKILMRQGGELHMTILKRLTQHGVLTGYVVLEDDGKEYSVSPAYVVVNAARVENAMVYPTGLVRAKRGTGGIVTEEQYNLPVVQRPVLNPVPVMAQSKLSVWDTDYHGKNFISICKRIRGYAATGRIDLEKATSEHEKNDGFNVHLFKMIEACGVCVKDFICGYLSVLQPYSLEKYQGSRTPRGHIWLQDVGYGFNLVIKINESDKRKPILVSFHESNFNKSYRVGRAVFTDKLCAVLVERVEPIFGEQFIVDYYVQRGFVRELFHDQVPYYRNEVALVNYASIKQRIDNNLAKVFQQLYSYYFNTTVGVENFLFAITSSGLSFLSNGYATANNLSMLIDLHSRITDERRAVLVELARNIVLDIPVYLHSYLRKALESKFGVGFKNALYLGIMILMEG